MADKPFLDSSGTVGRSFAVKAKLDLKSRNLPLGTFLRWEPRDVKSISITLPFTVSRKITITKKNGIKLAHWLLDKCSE